MSIFEAIVYGLIQGISEFLPVSSSGHLALLPKVMSIQDPGVFFDIMMHLGTALAVIVYFKKDIWNYVLALKKALGFKNEQSADSYFVRNFIISTMSSVILIVLLMPASKQARDVNYIIFNLSFFGLLLWLADVWNNRKDVFKISPFTSGIQWKYAVIIGLAQALAIFPGVSRSGITLTAALILGFSRKDASSYSFLLSLPIIIAGILKDLPKLATQSFDNALVMLTGVIVSFVVGYLTIHFFMKMISQTKLLYFSIYRWIIALILLIFL